MTTAGIQSKLFRDRNQVVARSFYRQLRSEGFSHEQIIDLSTTLLSLVEEDVQEQARPCAK